MKTHKDLDVWVLGIGLVTKVYKITRKFPEDEKFGLVRQMRKASVSIPSNIAEGAARNSINEFIQFLYISLGSLSELETQMIISINLEFIAEDQPILDEIEILRRKLLNLIKYQKSKRDREK